MISVEHLTKRYGEFTAVDPSAPGKRGKLGFRTHQGPPGENAKYNMVAASGRGGVIPSPSD